MTVAEDVLTANYTRFPVTFARGQGARLWDDEGTEYLDFLAGISVSNVGHCHPSVVAAITEQAARLIHVGNLYSTVPMVELAGRLARNSLGDGSKVFFANSGAEAVEAALKCARKAKQGGGIISLRGAFHGRTYGALSATPQESKQAPFAPLVPGFSFCEPTAAAITAAVDDRTAALILEPVQGESGVWPLGDEVLLAAREACDRHGAALIFDEVQCGLGRTGTFWHFQQTPVVPDLLTSAKGLGGGLPIGALIAGPISDRIGRKRTLLITNSSGVFSLAGCGVQASGASTKARSTCARSPSLRRQAASRRATRAGGGSSATKCRASLLQTNRAVDGCCAKLRSTAASASGPSA